MFPIYETGERTDGRTDGVKDERTDGRTDRLRGRTAVSIHDNDNNSGSYQSNTKIVGTDDSLSNSLIRSFVRSFIHSFFFFFFRHFVRSLYFHYNISLYINI